MECRSSLYGLKSISQTFLKHILLIADLSHRTCKDSRAKTHSLKDLQTQSYHRMIRILSLISGVMCCVYVMGLMSENISQLNNQRFFGQGGSRKFKSLFFSLFCFGLFYPSQVCESPPFSQTVDKPVDAKRPQHDAKNLAGEQGGRPPPSKQTA